MKIKIDTVAYDTAAKELHTVLSFVVSLEDLSKDKGYGRDSFSEQVVSRVSTTVAQKVIEQFEDELIKKVDMEAIVKKIQLLVVQSVTPTR